MIPISNALYGAYKQVLMGDNAVVGFAAPDLEGGDQRLILIDGADYTPNLGTHQSLADIPGISRVATTALAGTSVTQTSGVAVYTADDPTFSSVSGDQSELVVLFDHTGTEATSLLIVLYDTFSDGMPITPTGGDIAVVVNASGLWGW